MPDPVPTRPPPLPSPHGPWLRYAVLWNAFKRVAAGYSADEKAKPFSGTAKRIYRLA